MGRNEKTLEQIFQNRGVPLSNIMGVTQKDVPDPFLLTNMSEAIALLHKHIEANSWIYIQQDPDADGMTSTTALYQYIKKCYPSFGNLVVGIQLGKQHGIDISSLLEMEVENGIKVNLVIAPDASSNEPKVHKQLVDMGKEVLVLDHHEADGYSPYAIVVNPNLDSYPNKNISGVGVVHKFIKAYDISYGFDYAEEFYDLNAVGLIGDMIEVTTPEAVYITQRGMKEINNPFLKALYAKQDYSMKGTITPTGISFYIVPLLNATVRAGSPEEKKMVLKAMLTQEDYDIPSTKRGAKPGDTETMCEQAVRIMANIKARQARIVDKAIDLVESKIEANSLNDHQILIIDTENKVEKELTGLIANKIMNKYQKPTLIGSSNGKVLAGSGRGYDKSSLPDLRGFLNESGLVNYAEGHASAHGFSVNLSNLSPLLDHSNKELADLDFTPQHLVDFEWDYNELDYVFLEELTRLGNYWARGLDEPYFVIKNIPVQKSATEITGDFDSRFLKIVLPSITFVKFGNPMNKVEPFIKNQMTRIDVVGRVTMNEYQGTRTLQVFMEEFEVVGSQKFYF